MTMQHGADDIMLMLLRTALWHTPLDVSALPVSEEAWQGVFEACDRQTVLETVIPVIFTLRDEAHRPTPRQIAYLKSCYMHNLKECNRHQKAIAQVFGSLEDAGCHPVLLKGLGNASLYDEMAMRRIGDIDFFVHESKFQTAIAQLERFATPQERERTTFGGDHYAIDIRGIHFEAHVVITKRNYPAVTSAMLQQIALLTPERCDQVMIGGRPVPVPPVAFNSVYLFVHLWKHLMGPGIGLRHLSDLALHLHRNYEQIDQKQLAEVLSSMELLSVWQSVMWLLVHHLALPVSRCPLYTDACDAALCDSYWQTILQEGNFGHESVYKRPEAHLSLLPHHFIILKNYVSMYQNAKRYVGRRKALHYCRIHFVYHSKQRMKRYLSNL